MTTQNNPLTDSPPIEVPLPNSPLVRVIAQVRFPAILSIGKEDFIAPFQEAIRKQYPISKKEQNQGFIMSAQGLAPGQAQTAWRFTDSDGGWRVSLTPDFVAIETTSYTSRDDFFSRFGFILGEFNSFAEPAFMQRLGVRYIDRVTGDNLGEIDQLVRSEALGVAAVLESDYISHSTSETLFSYPDSEERILSRWGILPPKSTVDPNAVEPIDERSWILDLDMFSQKQMSFDPEKIEEKAREFSQRIYTVFRWVVTDEFLRRYGGQL